jgi:hypothetical protein
LPGHSYAAAGQHAIVDAIDAAAGPLGVLPDEVLDQRRNVFAAFPERRDLDRDDVQAIEEIVLEPAVGDHLAQVAIGGGDDADVDALRPLGAERLELPLLQHPQQLGLQRRAHRRDLVEKDRAAVRQRELPALGRRRAGERAADVAEQLRLEASRESPRS